MLDKLIDNIFIISCKGNKKNGQKKDTNAEKKYTETYKSISKILKIDPSNDSKIKIEHQECSYGTDLTEDDVTNKISISYFKELQKCNPGGMGVWLSNLEIYKKIVDRNLKGALILEDDADFLSSTEAIQKVMNDCNRNLPKDWDMLYLGMWLFDDIQHSNNWGSSPGTLSKGAPAEWITPRVFETRIKKIGKYLIKPPGGILGHAIIVSNAGAKKLLKLTPWIEETNWSIFNNYLGKTPTSSSLSPGSHDLWISIHFNLLNVYAIDINSGLFEKNIQIKNVQQALNESKNNGYFIGISYQKGVDPSLLSGNRIKCYNKGKNNLLCSENYTILYNLINNYLELNKIKLNPKPLLYNTCCYTKYPTIIKNNTEFFSRYGLVKNLLKDANLKTPEKKAKTLKGYGKTDPAREKQLKIWIDSLLIVTNIFEKYGITYWLSHGTLLGVYRYRGIIPWDHDVDLSVLRIDRDKIYDVLGKELQSYPNLEVWDMDTVNKTYLGVRIKDLETTIDLYGYYLIGDNYEKEKNYVEEFGGISAIKKAAGKTSQKIIEKIKNEKSYSLSDLNKRKKYVKTIPKYSIECTAYGLQFGLPSWVIKDKKLEYLPGSNVIPYNWIFPLKKSLWEGHEIAVPNETEKVLVSSYTDLRPTWILNKAGDEFVKDLTHPYWNESGAK